jgi:hypothetical protein
MKNNDEYLKENRIIYFQIAEENDFPDDDGEGWENWSDIIDQQRVNWILREMLTGALVANGKCTEYDSKNYIDNLIAGTTGSDESLQALVANAPCGSGNPATVSVSDSSCKSNKNTNLNPTKEIPTMEKTTIKVGNTYPVKVGKNEVEVTVKAQTAKGWLVETTKGRTFPVNDPARFILPEAETTSIVPESTATPKAENMTTEPASVSERSDSDCSMKRASVLRRTKLSMLEAAVEALKRSGKPMNVKEIIAAMIEANLWEPGPGKTPHLTLSTSIQRSLKKPNSQLPIKKSEERGKFEYIGEVK